MYYKPNTLEEIPVISNKNGVEILVSMARTSESCQVKLVNVYKPPGVPLRSLIDAIFTVVKGLEEHQKLIIMGDFNIDASENKEAFDQLEKFMSDIGVIQHICEPTTDMRTLIDHVYSNLSNIICGTTETYFSFHKAIWIALQ